jgi:hypothetical protein
MLEVGGCRCAGAASTAGASTIGFRGRARIVWVGVRIARFVLETMSEVGSAGSASMRAVRAASMCR